MIGRRAFLAGACCLAQAWPAMAARQKRDFICIAPDVSRDLPSAGSPPHPIVGASVKPESIWTPWDAPTPGSNIATINIGFLGGTGTQKASVKSVAPRWLDEKLKTRIAFNFIDNLDRTHVRIAFDPKDGNWSSVGIDSLAKPKTERTMNLKEQTDRAILHEFGHVLGLRHEHQHPHWKFKWVKDTVLAYYASVRGLEPDDPNLLSYVEENVFKHFSEDCVCKDGTKNGDTKPDPNSIMLYPFPADWTNPPRKVKFNVKISARDRGCLWRFYRIIPPLEDKG
jgi:hypothetical protein